MMPTDSHQGYYETYWSPEGFSPTDKALPESLRVVFERYVRAEHRAIDVGCGDGSKSGEWLSRHAAAYTGFDVSSHAVQLARARGFEAHLVDDASALPLSDASVDVAVCSEVLEHLFDPLAAVREIRRVLQSGGTLIVTVPNIVNWRSRLDFALLGRWHPGGDELSVSQPWRDPHIRFFTYRSLPGMLRDAGLEILEVGGIQDVSVGYRIPLVRRWVGEGPAGRPTRFLTRVVPGLWANHLYAVARS
jgi:SAM-dependent methyltransferase